MTQLEFARLLGVSATSVEYWERVGVPRTGMSKDVLMRMIESMKMRGEVWIGDVCLRRITRVATDSRGYVRHGTGSPRHGTGSPRHTLPARKRGVGRKQRKQEKE
jgi:hypothetical protein